MIKIEFEITTQEAIAFFRSKGITIVEEPVNGLFGTMGKPLYKVVNPANGTIIPLEKAFKAVIEAKQKRVLIDEVDRITIYQTLNNLLK